MIRQDLAYVDPDDDEISDDDEETDSEEDESEDDELEFNRSQSSDKKKRSRVLFKKYLNCLETNEN